MVGLLEVVGCIPLNSYESLYPERLGVLSAGLTVILIGSLVAMVAPGRNTTGD